MLKEAAERRVQCEKCLAIYTIASYRRRHVCFDLMERLVDMARGAGRLQSVDARLAKARSRS